MSEPSKEQLLKALTETPDASLEEKAERAEGVNGATVEPVYSQRKMKCYTVTESELRQIGLSNLGITGLFSLGAAFFAFGLDVFKDTLLAESVPDAAQAIVSYVQPICFFVSASFFVLGLLTIRWRSGLIKLIKDESSNS